jgi:hypothetical protein
MQKRYKKPSRCHIERTMSSAYQIIAEAYIFSQLKVQNVVYLGR